MSLTSGLDEFQRAQQLLEQWQLESAHEAYARALELEPEHAEALHGMGLLLGLYMLRSAEALPYLEAAIGARPREFSFWRTYIHTLLREGLSDMACSLIEVARTHGMQEIALEQLQKEVALVQGAQAASFLEQQAALWPLGESTCAAGEATARADMCGCRVPDAQIALLQQLFFEKEHRQLSLLASQLLCIHPNSGVLWKFKAAADNAQGLLETALEAARKAAKLLPSDAEAHFNLGGVCWQLELWTEAEQAMQDALALRPHWAQAFMYLGDVRKAQGQVAGSFPCYVNALLLEPANVKALLRLAAALQETGRQDECAQFLALLLREPHLSSELCLVCGNLLRKSGWLLQAETAYRMALHEQPEHVEALLSLNHLLSHSGRMHEAEVCLRRALVLAPERQELICELGFLLFAQKKWDQAMTRLEALLQERPDFGRAHFVYAMVLLERGDFGGLDQALTRGLSRLPDDRNLMFLRAGYWDKMGHGEHRLQQLQDLLLKHPDYEPAHSARLFALLHAPGATAQSVGRSCRDYGAFMKQRYAGQVRLEHGNSRDKAKILRVGFVSGDLRGHAVATFFLPVMCKLAQRKDLVCVAYCNNEVYDDTSKAFQRMFALWRGIRDMEVCALADLVRADGIDILIDLSGHTKGNRLDLFAIKPAPVQLTWIGNPASTGLETMDYLVCGNPMLKTSQLKAQITEQVMRLPMAYVFEGGFHQHPVMPLPGLCNGHLTFGSFNRHIKINRQVIAVWGQVLRALPASRLVLGCCPATGPSKDLREWLSEEGVDEARVRFAPHMDFDQYLQAHHEIDLCLDTFPFSGGVVTNHALWMGVPTLTLVGDLLAGAQSAEILQRVGLAEAFVAADVPQLLLKARHWSEHLPQLQAIRQGLRAQLEALQPTQADIVAQSLVLGLRQAWERWCEGLPAADLCANPDGVTF
ncbi:O-linked N-acetylglucosamine transferase family protein [Comamonas composti]|uniref:O-linked N-acetylglucosamine transferase family protein n=1 Tax=Comamonas composti TaxID=408558 RepID=UPI000A022EF9|nr:tetratricopeptide repeat protein [Comamonas composti]